MGTINLPPLTQKHQLNSAISRALEACSPQDMCLGDRCLSLRQALQKWRRRKKKEMLGVVLFPQAATPRSGSLWGKYYLPFGSLTRHFGLSLAYRDWGINVKSLSWEPSHPFPHPSKPPDPILPVARLATQQIPPNPKSQEIYSILGLVPGIIAHLPAKCGMK